MNTFLFKVSNALTKNKIQIPVDIDTEKLLGQIVTNRISGIAYNNINFNSISPDIEKALKVLYESAKDSSINFKSNLKYLSTLFKTTNFKYALLKGSVLSTTIYEEGYRTSNDIDILISENDITNVQQILKNAGFMQGWSSSESTIIKATRSEIITSRMNYGETIPFVKFLDKVKIVVDINFSLDYKPSNDRQIINSMLRNNKYQSCSDYGFYTLNKIDFLIHLCCHLYKEATTDDWVLRKRDLQLYKFSDINVYLYKYGNSSFLLKLLDRIKQFETEKECYYVLENSSIIYPDIVNIDGFQDFMDVLRPNDLSFMKQIVFPKLKKLYKYDMSFVDWFFCEDRIAQLEEISNEKN